MPHPNSPIQDPYLGRPMLHLFDGMIIACLKLNTDIAASTHGKQLTDLQRAACQIVPNGFSIALSIRELIRSGYLFSAEILLRPLVERVTVLSYLTAAGDPALRLWAEGWPHKSRPSLKVMLGTLTEYDETSIEGDLRKDAEEMIAHFNSVVHADPMGLDVNIGVTPTGSIGYLSGANLNDPARCDLICARAVTYMSILTKRATDLFPLATNRAD